jgi:hypothetical protein
VSDLRRTAALGDRRLRGRYPHRDPIAADGGQAPVAKESGKRTHAKFPWACNKRLRNALSTRESHHLALRHQPHAI